MADASIHNLNLQAKRIVHSSGQQESRKTIYVYEVTEWYAQNTWNNIVIYGILDGGSNPQAIMKNANPNVYL